MCLMCLFSMLLKKSGGKNLMTGTLNHVCDLGFPQRAECFSRKRTEDGCYSLKRLPQKKLNLILALSVCVCVRVGCRPQGLQSRGVFSDEHPTIPQAVLDQHVCHTGAQSQAFSLVYVQIFLLT